MFMLGDEHTFTSVRVLVWEIMILESAIGLGMKIIIAIVTLSTSQASNISSDTLCLWWRLYYTVIFLKRVSMEVGSIGERNIF